MLSSFSNISDKVNGPILLITAVCVFLLIVLTVAMIYFVIRYSRKRNPVASETHGHMALEVAWTIIPTLIAFGFFWYGWVGYKFMKSPPEDAMVVEVTGRMWSWSHEYENGVISPELNIPVNKAVRLNLNSADVLHSYFIPAFKVKQDAVPGVEGLFLWFEALQEGTFDVFCTEYCGLNHSAMLSKVNVMSQEEFDAWYAEEGEKVAATKAALEGEGGEASADALVAAGKHLATTKGCVACHSVDGSTLVGPSFKGVFGKTETVVTDGQERQVTVDEEYIHKSILEPTADITKGFQPLMPSQQGLVTEDEINALIEYIKSVK
jgi:cytochrome c oxidase subunit 2